MTMSTQQTSSSEMALIPLGTTLQTAREEQRLDRKDVAAQLRLTENVIDMIENDSFADNMPPIFVRGYTRAYGKLLQIPDDIIQAGLNPLDLKEPRLNIQESRLAMPVTHAKPQHNNGYLMKGLTIAIGLTLLWLVTAGWNNHTTTPATDSAAAINLPMSTVTTKPATHTAAAPTLIPAGISAPQPLSPPMLAPKVLSPALPTSIKSAANTTPPPAIIAATTTPKAKATTITPPAQKATAVPAIPAYKRAAMALEATHHASNLNQPARR